MQFFFRSFNLYTSYQSCFLSSNQVIFCWLEKLSRCSEPQYAVSPLNIDDYTCKNNIKNFFFSVTCSNSNSYCSDVGPRVTECLCSPGYHGYKCLRKVIPDFSWFLKLCFVIFHDLSFFNALCQRCISCWP